MKIYLDFNIIIDYSNNRDSRAKEYIEKSKHNNLLLPFSPAHIEEIAVSIANQRNKISQVKLMLDYVREITDSICLLPYRRDDVEILEKNGIYLCREEPENTYKRVFSKINDNAITEFHQKEKLSMGQFRQDITGLSPITQNNKPASFLLNKNKKIIYNALSNIIENYRRSYLNECLPTNMVDINRMFDFSFTKNYFPIHEAIIEKCMEILEIERFYPDKPSEYRSSTYDVTHCIYAAYCDIFISKDKRLKNKIKGVFEFLSIPTRVLSLEEAFVA